MGSYMRRVLDRAALSAVGRRISFVLQLKKAVADATWSSFGIKNKADVMCDWQADKEGNLLNVNTPVGDCKIKLKLLGRHNVMNALAAIAVSVAAGISLQKIVKGLEVLKPVNGRLQIKRGLNNSRVIDDTYNANPTSLRAALNVLHDFKGKRYLALGDMGELGSNAVELHIDAGIYAKQVGVDSLYSYGKLAEQAAKEFGDNGYSYNKHEDMINALRDELDQDVTLLVKGSRSMQMENIVNALTMSEG